MRGKSNRGLKSDGEGRMAVRDGEGEREAATIGTTTHHTACTPAASSPQMPAVRLGTQPGYHSTE